METRLRYVKVFVKLRLGAKLLAGTVRSFFAGQVDVSGILRSRFSAENGLVLRACRWRVFVGVLHV